MLLVLLLPVHDSGCPLFTHLFRLSFSEVVISFLATFQQLLAPSKNAASFLVSTVHIRSLMPDKDRMTEYKQN